MNGRITGTEVRRRALIRVTDTGLFWKNGVKRRLKGMLNLEEMAGSRVSSDSFYFHRHYFKQHGLNAKFSFNSIMVGPARSKAGTCFVIQHKEIATVEVTVHLFYFILIYYIRFLDAVKLGG